MLIHCAAMMRERQYSQIASGLHNTEPELNIASRAPTGKKEIYSLDGALGQFWKQRQGKRRRRNHFYHDEATILNNGSIKRSRGLIGDVLFSLLIATVFCSVCVDHSSALVLPLEAISKQESDHYFQAGQAEDLESVGGALNDGQLRRRAARSLDQMRVNALSIPVFKEDPREHLLRFTRSDNDHFLRFSRSGQYDQGRSSYLKGRTQMLSSESNWTPQRESGGPDGRGGEELLRRFSRDSDQHLLRFSKRDAIHANPKNINLSFSAAAFLDNNPDEENVYMKRYIRGPRFTKRSSGSGDHLLRFSRAMAQGNSKEPSMNRYIRNSDGHLLRFSKRGGVRKRAGFDHLLRLNKRDQDGHLLRLSKRQQQGEEEGDHLLRLSRSRGEEENHLRFSKKAADEHLLRFSKRGLVYPLSEKSEDVGEDHLLRFTRRSGINEVKDRGSGSKAHEQDDNAEEKEEDADQDLYRILRSGNEQQHLLRFSRSGNDGHFLRMNRSPFGSNLQRNTRGAQAHGSYITQEKRRRKKRGRQDSPQEKKVSDGTLRSNEKLMRYARSLSDEEPTKPRLVRQDAHFLRFN